jgi:hypothetical protein
MQVSPDILAQEAEHDWVGKSWLDKDKKECGLSL